MEKKEEKVALPEPESNQRSLEYRNANLYTRKLVNQLATEIGMRSVACTLRGKEMHWPKGLSIIPCRFVGDPRYKSAFQTPTLNECGWQRPDHFSSVQNLLLPYGQTSGWHVSRFGHGDKSERLYVSWIINPCRPGCSLVTALS